MIKSTPIFLLISVIAILHFTSVSAFTDEELTAKYHGDMSAIESDLSNGVLQCSDLPDNIKSGSCTDDAHKIVLPDGTNASPSINASTIWDIAIGISVMAIIIVGAKIFLATREENSYRNHDHEPKIGQISFLHSFLLKIGLAHNVPGSSETKEPEVNITDYDLTGIEDSTDKDRVSHELDEGFTSNDDYFKSKKTRIRKENQKSTTVDELSGFQQIMLKLGILKVTK